VTVRYNDSGAPVIVRPEANGAVVGSDWPKSATTPARLVVFYRPDENLDKVVGRGMD